MNAQVVIAVSSLVVGLFCVIFFYLAAQEGFDENSVFWGTLSIDGDDSISIKFSQDGVRTLLATHNDGTKEFITELEGELVHFNYDASGTLIKCGSDGHVATTQLNSFFVDVVDGVIRVGDEPGDGDEASVTLTYSFTEGEAAPDFLPDVPSHEDCKAAAVAGGRRLNEVKEAVSPSTDRRLSEESYMANDAYNWCSYEESSWNGWGTACVIVNGCKFAFRGSNDASDWISNGFGVFNSVNRNGKVLHGGFVKEFDLLAPHINGLVAGCSNPSFIGHSLGGAISSVARTNYGRGTTFTWGQPKVYDDNVGCVEGSGGIRMYHEDDPVPGNIFGFMGSYHHGKSGIKLYKETCCTSSSWGVCYWWGPCPHFSKQSTGCNDHSGTFDTDIGAHSMVQYHQNS
jgi:hypothetical protein